MKVTADRHPDRNGVAEKVAAAQQRLAQAKRAAAAAPAARIQVNVTDPDSRIMKTQQGWIQGYNVQAAVNQHQVVIAAAATQDHNDSNQLVAMMSTTIDTATAAGIDEQVGLVLADAGYWSEDNATAAGPDRLIATTKDWKQRRAAREMGTTVGPAPERATTLEAMEHRLRTRDGAQAYATRSHTVEPVFGDAKENHGFRRFMRRGLAAAHSETKLIFATHNLKKVFHHNPSVVFGTAQGTRRANSSTPSSTRSPRAGPSLFTKPGPRRGPLDNQCRSYTSDPRTSFQPAPPLAVLLPPASLQHKSDHTTGCMTIQRRLISTQPANRAFVEHVLAMDTTFGSPGTRWCAITDPGLITAACLAIIGREFLTTIVLVIAFLCWLWVMVMRRAAVMACRLSISGWLMQIILFGGGFIVVGGEWFQMWQSAEWNGMQAALRNFLVASIGLILAQLFRPEPSGPGE